MLRVLIDLGPQASRPPTPVKPCPVVEREELLHMQC